jgi:trigger factor
MDPNTFAQSIDQQGSMPAVVADVARRKALTALLERATVTDTAGKTIDLAAVLPGSEDDEANAEEAPSEEQ